MKGATRNKLLCHSYYVLFGMVGNGLLPAIMRSLEEFYGFSHTRMGLILGMGAVILACGGIVGGHWYDRAGPRIPFAACMAGCALGAIGIRLAPTAMVFVPALLAFQFANGLGVMVNPLVRNLYGERQAGGISLLHGFQGVGRFLAPVLVATCLAVGSDWRLSLVVSAALFAAWFFLVTAGMEDPPERTAENHSTGGPDKRRDPVVWLGILGFLFLSGGEVGIIYWLPNFLESEAGWPKTTALATLAWMMAGYTGVRLCLGLLRSVVKPAWILGGAAVLLVTFFLMIHTRQTLLLYALGAALGIALGPFWPCQAAALYAYAARGHGLLTGAFNLVSTLGALCLMIVIGALGDRIGLRHALVLPVVSCCAFAVLYTLFHHRAQIAGECRSHVK